MPVLLTFIVGAAAGFIAVNLMNIRVGALTAMGIGILGAIVGSIGLRALMGLMAGASSLLGMFVGALIGALALIWVYNTYFQK